MEPLGRLQRVDDIRTVWGSEAGDFTPWLAREENVALLAEAIGFNELSVEARELPVGPFRADIVCRDEDGNYVLIENQIERTNHTHLGQILTYAAGLGAATVVWVASSFTEEHRAALDWLNRITDERFSFFGLEIEAWRIGNSPVAPKFNVVSKPNNWSKIVTTGATDLSNTRRLQLEYWSALAELVASTSRILRPLKPAAGKYAGFPVGRTGFSLDAFMDTAEMRIGVVLFINPGTENKAYFHGLQRQRDEIENEVGSPLQWLELPNQMRSRIELYREQSDPTDRKDWSAQHKWLIETLEAFHKAFSQRIKSLPAAEMAPAAVVSD